MAIKKIAESLDNLVIPIQIKRPHIACRLSSNALENVPLRKLPAAITETPLSAYPFLLDAKYYCQEILLLSDNSSPELVLSKQALRLLVQWASQPFPLVTLVCGLFNFQFSVSSVNAISAFTSICYHFRSALVNPLLTILCATREFCHVFQVFFVIFLKYSNAYW